MARSDDVLVPLVNGPHQKAAINHAVSTISDGTVTVLNVVTPLDEPVSEGRVLTVTEARLEAARERAHDLVAEATRHDGRPVEVTVAEGRPARTAADWANAKGMDHIVVGGHNRSGLQSVLLGDSVASVIDDLTAVSVTVVDTPFGPPRPIRKERHNGIG